MKWLIRRFDHSQIYVLIAGTYTPFLTRIGQSAVAHILLAVVWLALAAGVLLKVALPGRYDRLSIALYFLIGWSGVFARESIAQPPSIALWLIVTGGLLYTLGVGFHVWLPFRSRTPSGIPSCLSLPAASMEPSVQAYAITPSADGAHEETSCAMSSIVGGRFSIEVLMALVALARWLSFPQLI